MSRRLIIDLMMLVIDAFPPWWPFLVASYALLWFTVLSPHGVVLTAYLQTRHVSPPALAAFDIVNKLPMLSDMSPDWKHT